MRRILENYFKHFGGIDPYRVLEKFEGREKLICQSLWQWVNAGSHFMDDDLYITSDEVTLEGYQRVFQLVFEKSGHGPHYEMMMGDEYQPLPDESDASTEEAAAATE